MNDRMVHIIGAGPAGLVAAINLARSGYKVVIHEQKKEVGWRFNADFQGIENWTTREDALDVFKTMGVFVNFNCDPYHCTDFYGPNLRPKTVETDRPLFYLIERGGNEWSLDQGLKRQALAEGVEIHWGEKVDTLPSGWVIVGAGPKAADAIAKGMVFQTSHPNYSACFLDNRIAPGGYAYLLVNNHRATFATCLFRNFRDERAYFQRALESLQKVLDIDINEPREFGGFVNFFVKPTAVKQGRALYVGENAGFQDALWGFGLRYAMLSGYLAAVSIRTGLFYDELCEQQLKPAMEASMANRWLFDMMGNWGYRLMLRKMIGEDDIIETLRRHCRLTPIKRALSFIAKKQYRSRLIDKQCMHQDCGCVWCRHCAETLSSQKPNIIQRSPENVG